MKTYPSIPRKIKRARVVAFDKLDGSNIRAEWSKKQGFYKFGSRSTLINEDTKIFGKAIPLIKEKEEQLVEIFKKEKWERAIIFFEFYGKHSFAGMHVEDDPHEITLIDVNPYKKGIISPHDFIEKFAEVGIPAVLHLGMVDEQFVTDVKTSMLDGMTHEGVVCKWMEGRHLRMFKIKSNAWIESLKDKCAGNDALFRRLL